MAELKKAIYSMDYDSEVQKYQFYVLLFSFGHMGFCSMHMSWFSVAASEMSISQMLDFVLERHW